MNSCALTFALATFCCSKVVDAVATFGAVVVEYSPNIDPSLDADTNLRNNVKNYVKIITDASVKFKVNIIVFPEIGLKGYGNQEKYIVVPEPEVNAVPCLLDSTYDLALVQLSCAARETRTYVVVNLPEEHYDFWQQRLLYFNTDVVFDSNGTIIARYRKIHLFSKDGKSSPVDKELVFFDTEFGVRFGIFTCFDIIFRDPGVDLANDYNISHFIFPTAWFSEMPFLTAIQEQWYWSYTLNVALLASGYNLPAMGSTGSGIYLGNRGPLVYTMTELTGTSILYAVLPKILPSDGALQTDSTATQMWIGDEDNHIENSQPVANISDRLKLKREFLDVYNTYLITVSHRVNETGVTTYFSQSYRVCDGAFCCNFSLTLGVFLTRDRRNISRGDDYSSLYYRLAAFDGVRTYDLVATGGLQTCAIIPCVNKDVRSCGLRSDDPSAQPNMIHNNYQNELSFYSIEISGTFSNNNSLVGPNILLGGSNQSYGSLINSDDFFINTTYLNTSKFIKALTCLQIIPNLVTASLYGRVFYRDGEPFTGSHGENSLNICLTVSIVLMMTTHVAVKFIYV